MIPYSIHVAILLAVCLLFYKLLLQKETYYRLNRVILLSCIALAFTLPLVPVPQQFSLRGSEVAITPVQHLQVIPQLDADPANAQFNEAPANDAVLPASIQKQTAATPIPVKQQSTIAAAKPVAPSAPIMPIILKWAFLLYWCGVAIFGANLLVQVIALLLQAYKKPVMRDGIYRIVELDTDKAPCSFGNNIFINPAKYDWETYNQILMHEKVHIQQGHSFDLITAELMLVVQWFNPFAWLYRRELESNLEFLTDDSVLHDNQVEPADYQLSLLKVSVPNFSMRITTNYNQSLLKKRIVMMNAKRSNVHTMWKYFMLMPLLVALVCGLNKPIALAQQKAPQAVTPERFRNNIDFTHGTWFATIKTDKVYIEFQADDNDDHHSWSSSHNFNLSELPNLPKDTKADFTLTREAGSVLFNGKFDGDQGIGHYKFTPNKDYIANMTKEGMEARDDDQYFSYFMADVKKDYVHFLKENFKDITWNQVISMSYQKIDAAYIKSWKDLGYSNLTTNQLVSLKSQKIDADYVNDIKKAGYTDLSIQQLISFHAQHITGDYINSLKKAKVNLPGTNADDKLTPQQVMTSKARHLDSANVSAYLKAGVGVTASAGNNMYYNSQPNQSYSGQLNEIGTLKSMNVTPEFIQSFEAVGFKDLSPNTLITLKREEITPEFVKAFKDMGYSDGDIQQLIRMKRQGITPEYVKSFASIGYPSISIQTLQRLTGQRMTLSDVKAYQALDFKIDPAAKSAMAARPVFRSQDPNAKQDVAPINGLSINTIATFKEQGITPEYIKGFQGTGLKIVSPNEFRQFKAEGITPENIKALQGLGYQDIPVGTIKLVTPDYIKSFQDIGYKNVTLEQYANLKRQGVTADFVAGFNKLGFTNIPLEQLSYLKHSGITPEFVSDMKQKGFDSKDLQRYVQLKNFNADGSRAGARTIKADVIEKNNK